MTKGPRQRYKALVDAGALTEDAAQCAAIEKLDALHQALKKYRGPKRGFFGGARPAPKGLYLWGGVGRGKTLLMDLFFNNTGFVRKRRVHFHEFMEDVHGRVAAWRKADEQARRRLKGFDRRAPDDPIPPLARAIADEALLLCFDEFHVTDIADAMILGRLFEGLFSEGVVVVATSNRPPDDLYRDGINRQLFSPFIDLFKARLEIFHLDAGKDYRLAKLEAAPVYYQPLGPEADKAMDAAWANMICGARERRETLTVKGRKLAIDRTARGAARFTFEALCAKPLGAADYLALVRRYHTIFMDRIPFLGPENRNEAKRFVTLIDTVYDTRTKFVCSAAGEPGALYPAGDGAFEFERTASRLMEMRTGDYLASTGDPSAAAAE